MEEKKPMTHVTAGLLIAAIIVVFAITTQFLGLAQQSSIGWLQYILIIGALIFFVNQYGKAYNYTKTFGNLFAYGFKATAVFTVIFIIFLVIFFLLFPEFKEKTFDVARTEMEKNEKLSDGQIEDGIDMVRKFFWVMVVGGSMLGLIIVGCIGSLLGAAITKKRPHNPLEQPGV